MEKIKVSTFNSKYKVVFNRREIVFSRKKSFAIFLYLLLNKGEIFNREELSTLFWSSGSTASALASLRNAIPGLYFLLPQLKEVLLTSRDSINIKDTTLIHCDYFDFINIVDEIIKNPSDNYLKIHDLIKIYEDDFLKNFYLKDAEEFNQWVRLKQIPLKEKFINALEITASVYESKKEFEKAVNLYRVILSKEPLEENIYKKIMDIYYRLRKFDKIHETFKLCQYDFKKELNSEPCEEIVEHYNNLILRKEIIEKSSFIPKEIVSFYNDIKFIGREKEISLINEFLSQMQTKILFVTGKAGIGKTRLIVEALKNYKDKFNILALQCNKMRQNEGFNLIIEMLCPTIPKIKDNKEDLVKKRSELFQYIEKTIENLDSVILFLDDISYLDLSSLELLDFLFNNLKGKPFYLIASTRSEEFNNNKNLFNFYYYFKRNNMAEEITLKPVNEESLNDLFYNPSNVITQKLYKETSGLPFYFSEILHNLEKDGAITKREDLKFYITDKFDKEKFSILTKSIEDFLNERLLNLELLSINLLECIYVFGVSIPLSILIKLVKSDKNSILVSLNSLIKKHFLNEQKKQNEIYYFTSHDKIKEYILSRMSETQKLYFKVLITDTLESLKDKEDYHEILFNFYKQIGDREKIIKYALFCHDKMKESLAFSDAFYYLKESINFVLEVKQKPYILEKMGDILHCQGKYKEAINYYEEVSALIGDAIKKIEIEKKIINLEYALGQTKKCEEKIRLLLKKEKTCFKKSKKIFLELKFLLCRMLINNSQYKEASYFLDKINESYKNYPFILSEAYVLKGYIKNKGGDFVKAKKYSYKGIEYAKRCRNDFFSARAYYGLGNLYSNWGKYDKAYEFCIKSKLIFLKLGFKEHAFLVDCVLAWNFLYQRKSEMAKKYIDEMQDDLFPANLDYIALKNEVLFEYYLLKGNFIKARKILNEYEKVALSSKIFRMFKYLLPYYNAKLNYLGASKVNKNLIKTVEKAYLRSVNSLLKILEIRIMAQILFELWQIFNKHNLYYKARKIGHTLIPYLKKMGAVRKIKLIKDRILSNQGSSSTGQG